MLEGSWKDFDEKNVEKQDEQKQKEHVREVYEHMQNLLGHKTDMEYIKKIKTKLATGRYPEHIVDLV